MAVANKARDFSDAFGAGDIGFLIGLWHDLGKFNPAFQDYLWDCHEANLAGRAKPTQRVPHAIWGAAFAYLVLKSKGVVPWRHPALAVKGHHAGLSIAGMVELDLQAFIDTTPGSLPCMQAGFKEVLRRVPDPLPLVSFPRMDLFQAELFGRMLLSALVDADRLATESHGRPDVSELRGNAPTLGQLWATLEESKPPAAPQSPSVKRVREEVYQACLAAALRPTGLFRLTVPTGGGKTRSGLAFALKHALQHDLRHIIVALPYTSIIDQTVESYRAMLGDEAVVEHHSAVDVPDTEDEDEATIRRRLATENWDAPIIVTTTVQLFESLFTNKPTKARKLHRLAKSVIVLDEAQTLPPELLESTLDAVRWLARPVDEGGFGATVVFCTATQPAFDAGPLFEICLRGSHSARLSPSSKNTTMICNESSTTGGGRPWAGPT